MDDFVSRLRDSRIIAQKSQSEVAKFLNISRQAYSSYETGTRKPDIDTLSKIADFFNVTTDYLLGRSGTVNDMEKMLIPKTVAAHTNAKMTPEMEARVQELIQKAFEKYVKK